MGCHCGDWGQKFTPERKFLNGPFCLSSINCNQSLGDQGPGQWEQLGQVTASRDPTSRGKSPLVFLVQTHLSKVIINLSRTSLQVYGEW